MNVTDLFNAIFDDVVNNATFDDVMANVTGDVSNVTSATPAMPRPSATRLPGLVDTATKDMVVEVVNCYLLPVVFVFGVSGNVMSLVVLLVHGMDTSTNVLLLGLTASDLCYLLSMFTRKVSCIVSKFDYIMSRKIEIGLLPTVYMINRIFGLTTPFLTMLVTVERCLAVTLPFKVQNLVTALRMKITVLSVFLFSIAAIAPFFLIYKGGEKGQEERRMTRMLMAVVVVYICMYIPGGIIGIANQVSPDFGSLGGRYNNLFYLVAALQLLLYACNSSCNFLIYMLLSKKFYNTYLRVFLCRGEEKKRTQTSKQPVSDQRSSTKMAVLSSTIESSAVQD